MKKKIKIVNGSYLNVKITYPEDLIFAKAYFGKS
ncbi:MAG: 2-C-methyl-D-erythritol 4-phosphate cytidylyltransferase [Candidatus Omnitrophica bacterium]|nr:2-C-methyl-D-erythritol 4-phosphate cytidylyltransferase [Candidatus Omnitrophota bacterium]